MAKKKEIDPKDLALFHEAMKGTTPLSHKKVRISKSAPKTAPLTSREPEFRDTFNLHENIDVPDVQGEEFISFKQPDISHKTLRKLRKGQYNVEAILDLHGMNIEEAHAAVEEFLQQCLLKKARVVLIIHGKGYHSQGPVLKNKLNQWLRSTKFILAFCSAAPIHGSRGAIYVLLRSYSEEDLLE